MATRRSSSRPTVSPRRRAIYGALLIALDHLMEEGVPRSALGHLDHHAVREWERLFVLSEPVVQLLLARPAVVSAEHRGAGTDPALTQLVVCAAGLVHLAERAGLLDPRGGPADVDAPPALVALRGAVREAYRYAQRARDAGLRTAIVGTAA